MVGVETRRLSEAVGGAGRRLGQARLAREQLGGGARVARRLPQPRLRPQRRQQRRVGLQRLREIRVGAAQIAAGDAARSPAPTAARRASPRRAPTPRAAGARGSPAATRPRASPAARAPPARPRSRASRPPGASSGSVSGSASFGCVAARARAVAAARSKHRAGRGVAAGRRQLLQRLRAIAIAPQLRRQRHRRVQHRAVAGRGLQRRAHRPPGRLRDRRDARRDPATARRPARAGLRTRRASSAAACSAPRPTSW